MYMFYMYIYLYTGELMIYPITSECSLHVITASSSVDLDTVLQLECGGHSIGTW